MTRVSFKRAQTKKPFLARTLVRSFCSAASENSQPSSSSVVDVDSFLKGPDPAWRFSSLPVSSDSEPYTVSSPLSLSVSLSSEVPSRSTVGEVEPLRRENGSGIHSGGRWRGRRRSERCVARSVGGNTCLFGPAAWTLRSVGSSGE